jgi:hypothetical protein
MMKICKASIAVRYIYLCWGVARFVISICKTGSTSYILAKYFRRIIIILFLWGGGGGLKMLVLRCRKGESSFICISVTMHTRSVETAFHIFVYKADKALEAACQSLNFLLQ